MNWFSRIRAIFRHRNVDADMSAEMRAHLDTQTQRNLAAGMSLDDARAAAHRQFGGVAQIQERARDERAWVRFDQTWRDVRHAGRMLRRNPGFAAVGVLSLALCLGANTAIFSIVHALVLRPLPLPEPEQIVEIYNSFPKVGVPKLASNVAQYADCRENAAAFAHVGLWRLDDPVLGETRGPIRVSAVAATAEMFDVLGVQPLAGTFFTAENHVPAADKVAVLTQSFWESHYQRDPAIVGRTLRLDGESFAILGVAPRRFEALDARVKLIRPLSWQPEQKSSRTGYSPRLFGRLKPATTIEQARAQVEALEQRYREAAPARAQEFLERTGHVVRVDTVQSQRAEPVKASLYLLQGGALFVLLIGCVNVANLILARFNARRGEFAMRASLGASRAVIVRQLFVESALLTGAGATLGLLLAWCTLSLAQPFTTRFLPDALPFCLADQAVGYLAATAGALALVFGLMPVAPMLGHNRGSLSPGRGRGASAGRHLRLVSSTLVVTQVAFALVLLTGAGLLIRSFAQVLAVTPGFEPQQLIGARLAVPKPQEKSFPPRLAAALQEIHGVTTSLATAMPFLLIPPHDMAMPLGGFTLRDTALPADASQPSVFYCGVSPSFLQTMRIPLREGRWFDDSDMERGQVVVVDESFANRYFPERSAVGQRLVLNAAAPQNDEDWLQIVGVVDNVRHNGVEDRRGQPFLYLPLPQMPLYGAISVFLRTERPVTEVVSLLRETIRSIDPEIPIVQAGLMDDVISTSFSNRRGIMLLLASFAGVALALSAVGIYGVLAYDVSQRTHEIGIRGAIGATRGQIIVMILRQGLWRVGVGLLLGLGGAFCLSRFMGGLLFEVTPADPLSYFAVSALLLLVALLACWLPARRAAKVDPIIALRAE